MVNYQRSFFKGLLMLALTLGSDLKVENMKIVCQVCGTEGYLQHIGKNYHRVRHYERLDPKSRKPIFTYHQQNSDYIKSRIDHDWSEQH